VERKNYVPNPQRSATINRRDKQDLGGSCSEKISASRERIEKRPPRVKNNKEKGEVVKKEENRVDILRNRRRAA